MFFNLVCLVLKNCTYTNSIIVVCVHFCCFGVSLVSD